MSVSRTCLTAVLAVGLLAGGGTAAAVPSHSTQADRPSLSRFDDGSFENPTVRAHSFKTFRSGQAIGPWRVTRGSVDLIGDGYWQAAEGDQSLDLNGATTGTVAQTFTTIPGTTYSVTYSLASNTGGGPRVKTGKALIDGQDFQDFSFDSRGRSRTNMGYVTRQFTFVATRSSTTLAFASTTPNSAHGPVIDDVQVRTSCCSCSKRG